MALLFGPVIHIAWLCAAIGFVIRGVSVQYASRGPHRPELLDGGLLIGSGALVLSFPALWNLQWASLGPIDALPLIPFAVAALRPAVVREFRSCLRHHRAIVLPSMALTILAGLLLFAATRSAVTKPLWIVAFGAGSGAVIIGTLRVLRALRTVAEVDAARSTLRWLLGVLAPPLALMLSPLWLMGPIDLDTGWLFRQLLFSPIAGLLLALTLAFGSSLALRARRLTLLDGFDPDGEGGEVSAPDRWPSSLER